MLNVAIVGSGMMGKTHGAAYLSLEGVRVTTVVDKDVAAGKALAETLGCAFAEDFGALKQAEVQIVDICLPTYLHLDAIRQASDFCKNIICEKPLALSLDEVHQVQKLVEQRDLRLMVAHVLRFWDCYVKAKACLEEGLLGKVDSVTCNRRQPPPIWSKGNWLFDISLSGGPTYDLIAHDIDYLCWLFGLPKAVMGVVSQNERGEPTHTKAELLYDGFSATVFGSWGMPRRFGGGGLLASLEMVGSEGMLFCDNTGTFTTTGNKEIHHIELERYDGYTAELRYFADCVAQGSQPEISNAYTVEDPLRVMQAVSLSSQTGKVVAL